MHDAWGGFKVGQKILAALYFLSMATIPAANRITERKMRDKQARRAQIISAARRIAEQEGKISQAHELRRARAVRLLEGKHQRADQWPRDERREDDRERREKKPRRPSWVSANGVARRLSHG